MVLLGFTTSKEATTHFLREYLAQWGLIPVKIIRL